MPDIAQILDNNGFEYFTPLSSSHIVDLEIVNYEPMIEYIDVGYRQFYIFINFIDRVPQETNFGLDFDVDGYQKGEENFIMKLFGYEDDFINELHRLNTIGQNIKG